MYVGDIGSDNTKKSYESLIFIVVPRRAIEHFSFSNTAQNIERLYSIISKFTKDWQINAKKHIVL